VQRKLNTGVAGEAVIELNEAQPMVFSFKIGNLNTDADIVRHQERGYWGIIVRGDGAVVLSNDVPFDFFELHGFMMWSAWGVLGLVQLFTNRYLKLGIGWKYTMWVHRIAGTLTLLITWIFAMLALRRKGWEVEVGVHQVLGVTILSLVTLIVVFGVINRIMMQRLRWRTADLLKIKKGHRWFGYFMLLLTETAIISGSLKYASYQGGVVNVPGLVHSFVFLITIILVESIYQKFNK
jgi:hypothetical protein